MKMSQIHLGEGCMAGKPHVLDDGCVDVFVTSEYILIYIIIVCCCTPIGDVCYPFTGCINFF